MRLSNDKIKIKLLQIYNKEKSNLKIILIVSNKI